MCAQNVAKGETCVFKDVKVVDAVLTIAQLNSVVASVDTTRASTTVASLYQAITLLVKVANQANTLGAGHRASRGLVFFGG